MQAFHSEQRMRLAEMEKTAEIGWRRRNRHQQPHFSNPGRTLESIRLPTIASAADDKSTSGRRIGTAADRWRPHCDK
jgi:hypothetical protein